MSDFDNREEDDKKEEGLEEVKDQDTSDKKEEKKEYEDVCFICRRPESKAGKMYHLPNNICVCDDCMHRTMDAVSQYDYQGMLNNPELMNMLNNMNKDGKYPNISFVNLADLQGNDGIPNKQKIKKKKEKEKVAEEIVAQWGQIDILLNIAGGNMPGATLESDQNFYDMDISCWEKVTSLNMNGTVYPSMIFGKVMAEQKKGCIINVSSMAAYSAITRVPGYSAAKQL